jgi:hypothetical protein
MRLNIGKANWFLWEAIINTKGQSLIELIMVLPLFIVFWAAIVWFTQAVIISIEMMHTARHGVFWLAYNNNLTISREEETQLVRNECTEFLKHQAPSLEINRVSIEIEPGDQWHPVGPKSLVDIEGIVNLMVHLRATLKDAAGLIHFQPASIKIEYALPAPLVLRAVPGFPASIPLRGYCVCYR